MNIQEFRTQYPEYDHVGDQQLADALYKKHYSHAPREKFDAAFLGSVATPEGYGEAALTMLTGAIAEPVAGLAGIASIPFKGAMAGDTVNHVRDALTYQPRTQGGKAALGNIAETLEPVTEALSNAESYLGDKGYELAGPIGGAIGETIPTAAMTLLGAKGTKSVRNASTKSKTNKALTDAAPSAERLKEEGRSLYKQIDATGTKIDDVSLTALSDRLDKTMKAEGFNARLHPKVSAVLDEARLSAEKPMSISEIDTFRKVAKSAAQSMDASEARLGAIMLDKIDDFLDNVPNESIISGDPAQANSMLKQARGYWGRARRAEIIDEAIESARNQASGFENGIRVQFRQILNNRKKRRGFSQDELDAMRTVVRGDKAENITRALGKFGFTEGQASSMLLSSLGVAAGASAFGPWGAAAIPAVGQAMRKTAQALTRRNAKFAKEVVTAGRDGRKIAEAYIRNTPKSQRSIEELTGLLLREDVDLANLSKSGSRFMSDAAFYASVINAAVVPREAANQ